MTKRLTLAHILIAVLICILTIAVALVATMEDVLSDATGRGKRT